MTKIIHYPKLSFSGDLIAPYPAEFLSKVPRNSAEKRVAQMMTGRATEWVAIKLV
jgi:hypothetical protein